MEENTLLKVPNDQIIWFQRNYKFINDDKFHTEGAEWSRLKNNILGENDRLFNYNGNSNSLLEGFWMGYSCGGESTSNTIFFIDTLQIAMEDCSDLEFFELAHNMKIVYDKILSFIDECNSQEILFDGEI